MLKMREEELERIIDTKRAAANEILTKELNDITNQILKTNHNIPSNH